MKKIRLLFVLSGFLPIALIAQMDVNLETLSAAVECEAFKINYPETWEKNESGMMGTTFILFAQVDSDTDQFKENVNLLVQDLTGMNIDLDQYTALSVPQIKQIIEGAEIIEDKRITDQGAEHHKLSYTGKQSIFDLRFEQLFWIKNEKAYVLTFTSEIKAYEKYKDLGMKIMHSFTLN